jgi:anti-sigma factor RsiW
MTPDPADLPTVLAAYADGELDAATRAAIELWFDAHPEGWALLRAQCDFSPENRAIWAAVEPPAPSGVDWERVRDGVAARLRAQSVAEPSPARPVWKRRAELALVGMTLALALFVVSLAAFGPWFLPPEPQRARDVARRPAVDDPLDGIAVLRIATDAEVDVQRVEGAGSGGWLPVGGVPLTTPLALATAEDVELEEAEPHPGWPAGGPQVTREPTDTPILWPNR